MSAGTPLPSLPMRRATGPLSSDAGGRLGARTAVVRMRTPASCRRGNILLRRRREEGRGRRCRRRRGRPWVPRADVPGRPMTPLAPKASAERRIVPRLPGSWRPAKTTISGAGACDVCRGYAPRSSRAARPARRWVGAFRLCRARRAGTPLAPADFNGGGRGRGRRAGARPAQPTKTHLIAGPSAALPRAGSDLRCRPAPCPRSAREWLIERAAQCLGEDSVYSVQFEEASEEPLALRRFYSVSRDGGMRSASPTCTRQACDRFRL